MIIITKDITFTFSKMFEILSVNVRGLNSDEKRVGLYTWVI